jgi:hypothetical protein
MLLDASRLLETIITFQHRWFQTHRCFRILYTYLSNIFLLKWVATRKARSVNERRQRLRDFMTMSGRITTEGVPAPFTQGNPRAVKWVRNRTDQRLNKTLNEGKVVLSQNRVTVYWFPQWLSYPEGLSISKGGVDVCMPGWHTDN